MKLVFAGTRGHIGERSPRHRRHSSLLVAYRGRTILIDCGEDWLGHLDELDGPRAVIVTHAHPDHAGGLKEGCDRPVWATRETWKTIGSFPLKQRHVLQPRRSITVAGIDIEAFAVEHSTAHPPWGCASRRAA